MIRVNNATVFISKLPCETLSGKFHLFGFPFRKVVHGTPRLSSVQFYCSRSKFSSLSTNSLRASKHTKNILPILSGGLQNIARKSRLYSASTTESSQSVGSGKASSILVDAVGPNIKASEKTNTDDSSKSSADKSKKSTALFWTKVSFAVTGVMCFGFGMYCILTFGPPDLDERGAQIKDEFSEKQIFVGYVLRTISKMRDEIEETKAPSRRKLLPDPLQEPYYQPPYTLVIEMTDLLVHPEYSWHTGWRFKKRPGVDAFLQQVGPPLFEIVIYTSEGGYTAWPVLDSLDPNGFIMYRLFRDATRYERGKHIKDLNCLNRDLAKVIAVDWDRGALSFNEENSFIVKRWEGEDDDRQLILLAQFLRTMAMSGLEDVRPALRHYGGEEDPLAAFRFNQMKLEEEVAQRMDEKQQQPLAERWRPGLFGRRK